MLTEEMIRIDESPRYVWELEAVPAAVPRARAFVEAALEEWRLPELAEDAVLVASELVTNAIRHANRAVLLVRRSDDGRVLIEVWDDNRRLPVPRQPRPPDPHGRGLFIVDALATEWGARPAAGGKVVWASFAHKPFG